MSTAVAPLQASVPALQMNETELLEVLGSSLYPGAKVPSIKLVVGYCKAAGLDPMQKPVHIVPMYVKDAGTGQGAMRDVVMPGIGLYRIQAARTGQYAGISEPEFGAIQTLRLGDFSFEYPAWCKVTVRRFNPQTGQIFDFTAMEYWIENYATKSRDSKVPNDMWQRRPFAQIAKCAEAQALRKAFPETGAQPTAEEMEGRDFDGVDLNPAPAPAPARQGPQSRAAKAKAEAQDATVVSKEDAAAGAAVAEAALDSMATAAATGATANDPLVGEGELAFLRKKAEQLKVDLPALAAEKGIDLSKLTKVGFVMLKGALAS
jgi:phage recombination protein Bet